MTTAHQLRERIAARSAARSNAPRGAFVTPELLASLGTMTRHDADALEFGAIQVDDAGKILIYNRFQSSWAGVPVHQAEGKNFFTQLAPCTSNNLFFGTFKRGVASDSMSVTFAYTFTYRVKPTGVRVLMARDSASRTNWIFLAPA